MYPGSGPCKLKKFNGFTVNLTSKILLKGESVVEVEPKPFQMLEMLLEEPGRVVSPAEFKSRLWPDVTVEITQNINTQIGKLRKALDESAEQAFYILTKRREGYSFNPDVHVTEEVVAEEPEVEIQQIPIGPSGGTRRRKLLLGTSFAIALCVALGALLLPPRGLPHVISSAPITHTDSVKYAPVLSDGINVYYTETEFGQYRIAKLKRSTQEVSIVSTQVPQPPPSAIYRQTENRCWCVAWITNFPRRLRALFEFPTIRRRRGRYITTLGL